MRADQLLEAREGAPSAQDVHGEADAPPAAVSELLPVNRRRQPELQEEPPHVHGEHLGRGRIEDGSALPVHAAITLDELADQDRHRAPSPSVDECRHALVQRTAPLEAALLEEERHCHRRSLPILPRRTHRRRLALPAVLDAGRGVAELRQDSRHVLDLVGGARVEVEVSLVAQASFGEGVAQQGGTVIRHRLRSAGRHPG